MKKRPQEAALLVDRDQPERGLPMFDITCDPSELQRQVRQLSLANASLQESLVEFERLYERTPVGLCLLDADLCFVRINQHLADINGSRVEEHIGRTLREVAPRTADQAEAAFRDVLESGEPIVDVEVTGPFGVDDKERVWRTNAHSVTDSSGVVTGLSVVVQDITDLRAAQRDLEERLLFERLIADLSMSFSRLAPGDVHEEIGRSLQRVAECLGAERTTVFELCEDPRELRAIASFSVPEIFQLEPQPMSAAPWGNERLVARKPIMFERLDDLPEAAGAEREMARTRGIKSLILLPLAVGDDLLGTLAIATVSEERQWPPSMVERVSLVGEIFAQWMGRRRAEKALELSEERFRWMVEHAPDAMIIGRADGDIVQVNRLTEKLFGYSSEELIGMPVRQLIPAASLSVSLAGAEEGSALPEESAGARRGIERQGVRKDGTEFQVEVSLSPIGTGELAVAAASIRDVSERIAHEKALENAVDDLSDLRSQLEAENLYLKQEAGRYHGFEEIVGQSEALRSTLRQVEQVAETESTVLLYGETGTGKELLARAIHRQSRRKQRAMVTLNCGALQPSLVESELFGREKGAYTGASSRQLGRFELADGSTLFLDEVGELLPEIQVKLLRVLEEGEFERLGSPRTLSTDVRIVAASNRDLEDLVRKGRFRQDLFYRLNVFPIKVPTLRERSDDIPLLVEAFMEELGPSMGKTVDRVPQKSMDALIEYDWPGNVRELRNVIERAMILSPSRTLLVSMPQAGGTEPIEGLSFAQAQRKHILAVLERSNWRVRGAGGAAELLELKPTTLEYKMKKLQIRRSYRDHGSRLPNEMRR